MSVTGSTWRPTVIIPTYQRRDLIGRAVESVLAQEPRPHEVIVVDDGSTDGTEELVRSFPRVRYIRQENRGAASARNLGVLEASSDWVAFLDSDDVWLAEHLARLSEAVRATDGRADVYFSDAIVGGARCSRWFATCGFHPMQPFEFAADPFSWAMLPFQPMLLPTSVVRRAAWLGVGGLREDLPTREDTHIFFRLALEGGLCALRDAGVEVTADSRPGLRLTEVHRADGLVYQRATIVLYEDILAAATHIDRDHRRQLRRRLARAYLRLARTHYREPAPLLAARNAAIAAKLDPTGVTDRLSRRLLPRGRR